MLRFLFSLFIFPFATYASISIEPYVGGGLAHFSEIYSGFSIGSRLGYKKWGLMSGVDISYAHFETLDIGKQINQVCANTQEARRGVTQLVDRTPCDDNMEQAPTNVYNMTSIGPSVSFGLPLIINAYASIHWSWAKKQINIDKSFALSGPGAKLGISYLSLPFLQLNLELQGALLSCSNSLDSECMEQNDSNIPIWMGQIYISVPISTGLF